MKKILIIAFVLLLLLVSACQANEKTVDRSTSESINSNDLPYSFDCFDKTISLNSIATYESKDSSGYNLFLVTELDVSAFTEDEVRDFRQDDLLSIYYKISSEENKLDDGNAVPLGSLYYTDSKKLVYVHLSDVRMTGSKADPYTHSFINSSYTLSISVKESKYAIPNYYLFCRDTITELEDPETIPNPLHDKIVSWLNDKASFWQ